MLAISFNLIMERTDEYSIPRQDHSHDKDAEEALTDAKKIDEKNVKSALHPSSQNRYKKVIINESKDFRKTILNDGKE